MKFTEKEQLIMLRKRKKISQGQIAQALNITQAYVSLFENDKCDFNHQLFYKYKAYIVEN